MQTQMDSFCPHCLCKYERRSLTMIKFTVIFVVWFVSVLIIYMFLTGLGPLLSGKSAASTEEAIQPMNDDDFRLHDDETTTNRWRLVYVYD